MSKGSTKAITKATTKTAARAKRYEDLEFTDDFMFCKILQNNPDLCKELTELIIGRKIGGIIKTEHQKSIEITADGKGVRFDVYLEDDENTVYDISGEMKAFLQFLTKKQADSALTQKLQKEVQKAREQKRWRQEYMTLYEKLKDEREAGREEGIKQGIERGELSHLVRIVCKKLQKNMSAAEIADILEEDENMIELIGDAAAGYAPDYDVEAIVEHLFQRTEKEDIVAH